MKAAFLYCLSLLVLVSCSNAPKAVLESNPYLKLENGVLYFENSPFTGNVVRYNSSNTLQLEIQYVEGLKSGHEKQWFQDGTLALERYYEKGLKTGIHKAWWENKKLKFEYHFNTNGEFHGLVKEWYQTGQAFCVFNYENGQEVGSQRLWKTDGSIKANYEVLNDERFGLIGLKKCFTVNDSIK